MCFMFYVQVWVGARYVSCSMSRCVWVCGCVSCFMSRCVWVPVVFHVSCSGVCGCEGVCISEECPTCFMFYVQVCVGVRVCAIQKNAQCV